MEHATPLVRIMVPIFSLCIVVMILTARRRQIKIRRIHGLTAIEEAIGRATEMGRPMVCTTGLGTSQAGIEIVTLQALSIVTYIVRASAKFATKAILPVFDPQMLPVTQEAMREAYNLEGRPDLYNSEDVRYLTNNQFSFAASVAGLIWREKAGATFMFGIYYAESLILSESGNQVGAIQIAGTPATTQIPFFIATCDYVIIGDEFYAASAYLSKEPTALGSIVGQDIAKGLLFITVILGSAVVTFSQAAGTSLGKTILDLFK